MQYTTRASSLSQVASRLTEQGAEQAAVLGKALFPWIESQTERAAVPPQRAFRIFLRDRFTDRYSGSQLVFPGALLAMGLLMPHAFPIHPTWKVSKSHEIYWELWPVIDHVQPVTRHGSNDDANLVTTSTRNNTAKGASLLSELGWSLRPIPEVPTGSTPWDGLMGWFLDVVKAHPQLMDHSQLRSWHRAAVSSGHAQPHPVATTAHPQR